MLLKIFEVKKKLFTVTISEQAYVVKFGNVECYLNVLIKIFMFCCLEVSVLNADSIRYVVRVQNGVFSHSPSISGCGSCFYLGQIFLQSARGHDKVTRRIAIYGGVNYVYHLDYSPRLNIFGALFCMNPSCDLAQKQRQCYP